MIVDPPSGLGWPDDVTPVPPKVEIDADGVITFTDWRGDVVRMCTHRNVTHKYGNGTYSVRCHRCPAWAHSVAAPPQLTAPWILPPTPPEEDT